MHSRRAVLLWALLMSPMLWLGCGGYSDDNTPEIVVTQEMMDEMRNEEAERMELYRKAAADKGLPPPGEPGGGPSMPGGFKTTKEKAEKRAERREERAARTKKK